MAEWSHRTCERCWFDGYERLIRVEGEPLAQWELEFTAAIQGESDGVYRLPVQVKEVEPGPCCVCGGMTVTGIYFRRDQEELTCKGRHEPAQFGEWSRVS